MIRPANPDDSYFREVSHPPYPPQVSPLKINPAVFQIWKFEPSVPFLVETTSRKRREVHLISKLGTVHPYGIKDAVQSDLRMCTKEPSFYLQTVDLGFYFILCSCKA
jgi:hypothetical protein